MEYKLWKRPEIIAVVLQSIRDCEEHCKQTGQPYTVEYAAEWVYEYLDERGLICDFPLPRT